MRTNALKGRETQIAVSREYEYKTRSRPVKGFEVLEIVLKTTEAKR
jgi:hypothetical protein